MRQFATVAALCALALPAQAATVVPGETIDAGGWRIGRDRHATPMRRCMVFVVNDAKGPIGFATDSTEPITAVAANRTVLTAMPTGSSLVITMGDVDAEEPLDGSFSGIAALGACQEMSARN